MPTIHDDGLPWRRIVVTIAIIEPARLACIGQTYGREFASASPARPASFGAARSTGLRLRSASGGTQDLAACDYLVGLRDPDLWQLLHRPAGHRVRPSRAATDLRV